MNRPVRHRAFMPLYAAVALYWFAMYTYVPTLSPYLAHLGATNVWIGVVLGSYGLVPMILRVPAGVASDRAGVRKPFVFAGMVLAACSSLGFALTSDLRSALVWRAMAGAATASWVPFTVLYASHFAPEEAGRAMGIISLVTSLGQMVATTAGGYAADRFGWHAPFVLGAAGGLLGLVAVWRIREAPKRPVGGTHPSLRPLLASLRERPVWTASVLAVMVQSATFTTLFGFTPLHAAQTGASKAELGLLTLASTLFNAVGSYLGGSWFTQRLGVRRTAGIGFAGAALFTAAIPWTSSYPALVATQSLNGFAQGLVLPVLMGAAIRGIDESRRASAMGFFQAIYAAGICGGPFLTGWLSAAVGLTGGFLFTSGLCLAGTALTMWWLRPVAHRAVPAHTNTPAV
ncbi:MAG: MFS transporter [Alicyclobacillaceae bacterium]|nr:MFS transporter [Alicyclobacillaceae bacterium]